MKFDALLEEVLLEGVLENTVKQFPELKNEINFYSDNVLPNDKKNITWVIKQHRMGNITPNDSGELKERLEVYEKNKKMIGKPLSDMDYKDLMDNTDRFTVEKKNEVKAGKIVYEDPDLNIQLHKGYSSCAKMGQLPSNNPYHADLNGHAKWCISLRGGANTEHVDNYTENGKWPVYSITNRKTGRKYALVASQNRNMPEFRDEHDARPDAAQFMFDNPSILKHEIGHYIAKKFNDADMAKKIIENSTNNLSSKEIDDMYEDAHRKNDMNTKIFLANRPNASSQVVTKLFKELGNSGGDVYKEMFDLGKHPNLDHSIIDDSSWNYSAARNLARYSKIEPSKLHSLLSDKNIPSDVKTELASHQKLDDKAIDIIHKTGIRLRQIDIHPDISEKSIDKIIENPYVNNISLHNLAKADNITSKQLERAVDSNRYSLPLINHPSYTVENRKNLLKKDLKEDKVGIQIPPHQYENKPIDDEELNLLIEHRNDDNASKNMSDTIFENLLNGGKLNDEQHRKVSNLVLDRYIQNGEFPNTETRNIHPQIMDEYLKNPHDKPLRYPSKVILGKILPSLDYKKHPELLKHLIDYKDSNPNRLYKLSGDQVKELHGKGKISDTIAYSLADDEYKSKLLDTNNKLLDTALHFYERDPEKLNELIAKGINKNRNAALSKAIGREEFDSTHVPLIIQHLKNPNLKQNHKDSIVNGLIDKNMLLTHKEIDEVVKHTNSKTGIKTFRRMKDKLTSKQINHIFDNIDSHDYKNVENSVLRKLSSSNLHKLHRHLLENPLEGKNKLEYLRKNNLV